MVWEPPPRSLPCEHDDEGNVVEDGSGTEPTSLPYDNISKSVILASPVLPQSFCSGWLIDEKLGRI